MNRHFIMKGCIPFFLVLSQVICDDSLALSSMVENRFEEDTDYCKKSAEEVHANSVDPTRELNHFLLCLSKKAQTEVEDPDLQGPNGDTDPELEEVSAALTKILYAPLFREDVHDFKKRLVKRYVQPTSLDMINGFVAGLKRLQKKRFGLRTKRQAPQLDETILSALVNNPEALQLVLDYLKKNEGPKNKSKPQRQSAPQRNQRRPFSTNTNRAPQRRNDSPFRQPSAPQKLPFRVQQLNRKQHQLRLKEQEEKRKQALIQQRLEHEKKLKPLVSNEERADNPILSGKFGNSDLQFFGPSDYRPDQPYALPSVQQKENGEKVYPWQVGYIPIPR